MLYDVHFKDGSVGQVEATSTEAARRLARRLNDEAVEAVLVADEDEEEVEEEDDDDGDLDEDEGDDDDQEDDEDD